jgi:hypothetical protein
VRRRTRAGATLPLLAAALAACGSAQGTRTLAHRAAAQPCGAAAPETLAHTIGTVATRIYGDELAGAEVRSDRRQVEGFAPLLRAVASGNRSATLAAVESLVFSHTHIVRLRVTRGGRVLADVGGPEILAPVSGSLRHGGQRVGEYVLSVQDDLGYVKLVTRFIGVPIVLRASSLTLHVPGTLGDAPAVIPALGPLSLHGKAFEAFSFNAQAFPSGPLRVSLLAPLSPALSARPCNEVRIDELGDVARNVSRRFSLAPGNFSLYIKATAPLTGGLIYIRSQHANGRELAGSTHPGPRALPLAGTVSYRGRVYGVFSFTRSSAAGEVRIYQLVRE